MVFFCVFMLSFFLLSPVLAGDFSIPEDDISRLSKLYQSAQLVISEADALRQNLDVQQVQVGSLTASIDNFEKEIQLKATDLAKIEDFARSNPDLIKSDVIDAARSKHTDAFRRKKEALNTLSQAKDKLMAMNVDVSNKEIQEDAARSAYLSEFNATSLRLVSQRIDSYKKPQQVTESGSAACESLTVKDCKLMSLKEAERKAIEKGSVIVVDSLVEINNLTLTTDQARSEVRGEISERVVIESKLINDDTVAYTSIRATVTPAISDSLRDEIQRTVRESLSARVGDGGLAISTSPKNNTTALNKLGAYQDRMEARKQAAEERRIQRENDLRAAQELQRQRDKDAREEADRRNAQEMLRLQQLDYDAQIAERNRVYAEQRAQADREYQKELEKRQKKERSINFSGF